MSRTTPIVGSIVGLIGANLIASYGYSVYYRRTILDTLIHGTLPAAERLPSFLRNEVKEEIRSLLRPIEPSKFFHVVFGQPGCGKSSLIKAVAHEINGGVGLIDVSPATESFGIDLGETFGFKFEQEITIFNWVTRIVLGQKAVELRGGKLTALRRSAEALQDAAREYKLASGQPFVLIVDSIDRLLTRDTEIFLSFLQYAGDWAGSGDITVLFVANDWRTVEAILGDHPTKTRTSAPLTIGRLSDNESLQLLKHWGVRENVRSNITKLVGGDFALIQKAANMSLNGSSFAEIESSLLQLMKLEFQRRRQQERHEDELKAFEIKQASELLLNSPSRKAKITEIGIENTCIADVPLRLQSDPIFQVEDGNIYFASELVEKAAKQVFHVQVDH